ncbi:type II toxin-antitoxin system HipA family toxin [Corynebacterium sp.]|uniref:type II toxin-antitoxin system HipA family toxin n=1 Tax=Corynebacterium sp. TaxID=1720 RepID=UPI0026DEF40C|nr:HipA domain-containing protein [Corynebacterium sp.]MDO5511885.1 HipA domain-containing protein [Corynebacterium sp.]
MTSRLDPRVVPQAAVYVGDTLAAHLTRTGNDIEFRYTENYLATGGPAVATTLPLGEEPVITRAGAVPPYFAGLLPEGRRLTALRTAVKASADDELSLLLAVGADPVGAVAVLPVGTTPTVPIPRVTVDATEHLDFATVLAAAGVPDPVALAGVQDKVSARTLAVPVDIAGSDAILKLSPPEFPGLVDNEWACYRFSRRNRLRIAYAAARRITDMSGRAGLLVSRFDRPEAGKLPVEDVSQLLGIWPAQKYSVTMEQVADVVARTCSSPVLALRQVAFQLAMAWLSGNGDLHAKNISVLHDGHGFSPSPIYDIPSTVPYGDHDLALSVGGSTTGFTRKRFNSFTDAVGLPRSVADSLADEALRLTERAPELISEAAGFDPRRVRDLRRVLTSRRRHWDR